MKTAEAVIYLDDLRPKKTGECSVKIKVTHNRKRKYYATGINLTPEDFKRTTEAKRRSPEQKEIFLKLNFILNKAQQIIQDLPIFTFTAFEISFLEQRNTRDSVSFAFEQYTKQLRQEERIGTATTYECAMNSLSSFSKDLTFAEITPKLLKQYEKWMLDKGNSLTTVGIYLRSLRAIYNQKNIDRSIYPFGDGRGLYSIPTGRNIKKALTIAEIGRIYNHPTEPETFKDMAKDYWMFLYLCNGMNVKDFCLLRWENIEGDFLTYTRAKTKRSRKDVKPIKVALKAEAREIIRKWGRPAINKQAYIFPHLDTGMTPEREREIYQQLTKVINKHMKRIGAELGIEKEITTYFARHSFATVLKRAGTQIEMISELLGHSNVGVTESYLDGFENDQIQAQTDVLTAGFKQAN
jgi:integrase/recombinase XerD